MPGLADVGAEIAKEVIKGGLVAAAQEEAKEWRNRRGGLGLVQRRGHNPQGVNAVRTFSGAKIHRVSYPNDGQTWCGIHSRGRRFTLVRLADVRDANLCDKCFPGGRPPNPSNPSKRRRPQQGFDAYQPDLFGGRHKERGEGRTRQEQLEFAREEMRDTGSPSLFEFLEDHIGGHKRSNPSGGVWVFIGLGALALASHLSRSRAVAALQPRTSPDTQPGNATQTQPMLGVPIPAGAPGSTQARRWPLGSSTG